MVRIAERFMKLRYTMHLGFIKHFGIKNHILKFTRERVTILG